MKALSPFKRLMAGFIAANLVTLTSSFAVAAGDSEGVGNTGGGDPNKTNRAVITKLLDAEQNILKISLLNYLDTVAVEKIADPEIKKIFTVYPGVNQLKEDIRASEYLIRGSNNTCHDRYNHKLKASAQIAQRGGKICFDVDALAKDFSAYIADKAMIELASLALHEHIHHFQIDEAKFMQANEIEAYNISAYVSLTARTASMPILEWSMSPRAETQNSEQESYCTIASAIGSATYAVLKVTSPKFGKSSDAVSHHIVLSVQVTLEEAITFIKADRLNCANLMPTNGHYRYSCSLNYNESSDLFHVGQGAYLRSPDVDRNTAKQIREKLIEVGVCER
jgi:hypothetical protein